MKPKSTHLKLTQIVGYIYWPVTKIHSVKSDLAVITGKLPKSTQYNLTQSVGYNYWPIAISI